MKLCHYISMIGIFMLSLFSFAFSNCEDGTDVCLSLDGNNLNYESTADIAGFQFDHDGCVTGASGGDATVNGFTISASSTVVLAFSFTGSVIPAGSGTLVVLEGTPTEECLSDFIFSDSDGGALVVNFSEAVTGCTDSGACNYNADAEVDDGSCEYVEDCSGDCGGSAVVDCNGDCGGSAVEDCNGDCGGSAVEDACGECGGDATDPNTCVEEGYSLDIGAVTDSTLEIIMNNEAEVAGFQFLVTGVNVTGASGGSADDNGFSTSTGSTGTVLGFSFTGSTIPPSNAVLTVISFDSMDGEVCITDAVLSNAAGEALDVELGDCYCGLTVDCAGECGGDAVVDCADECNGDTEVDCAGECGGDAVEDCAGNCDGDAVVDCAGDCNGTAEEDVCGECNGDETDIDNCFDSNELFIHSFTPTSETNATLNIYMSNLEPVAGFEFRVTSSLDGFELGAASGGSAADPDADFSVSTSGTSGMVLGFSFSGGTIPYGYGLLTSIDVSLTSTTDMMGYIYITEAVIADSDGIAIDFGVEPYFSVGGAPDAPDAPTNLAAEVVLIINVDVGWDSSDNADYYTLYRNALPIAEVTTPGYYDENLNYETSYEYKVTASNGAGESATSNAVNITTGIEPFDPVPPANLMAVAGDEEVTLTWEEPVGAQESIDCQGNAFDPFDAVYSGYDCLVCNMENDAGDVCGEGLGDACVDWLGDGFCDDGSFGFYFDCEDFGCDCMDCGFECDDPYGHCGEIVPCTEITNFEVSGSVDLDGDGVEDPCYNASDGSSSHYFMLSWEGDCSVTDIYWGVDSPYENGGNFGNFMGPTLLFYGFGPDEAYQFVVTNSNQAPPVESDVATAATGPEDCAGESVPCDEQPGMVDDCSGDGDCCPESWIGDGYGDCEDQAYGCDLTCYDNDGGDCGGFMSGGGSFVEKFSYMNQYNRVSSQYPYSETPNSKETGELGDYSGASDGNDQTREEILSYNLYMGTMSGAYGQVGTTSATTFSYTISGLENGTEYFFVATAVYEGYDPGTELESPYSNEASATPVPFEAPIPENLTASPGDNEVILNWDEVIVQLGPGDECDLGGATGMLDCQDICFDPNQYLDWVGDGFCDDGTFGIYFTCEEFGCDCGDCEGVECDDPNGYCSDRADNTPSGESKEFYNGTPYINEREEDFVGYNVYRSLTSGGSYDLVANVLGEIDTYTDTGLTNGQMYHYVVTSQFEETESAYSNEASAQPMDFIQLSMSEVSGVYSPGDTFEVIISWENPAPVAGIQIVFDDPLDAVTMTNVEGLGVLAGEDLNSFSSDFNGVATILWFSLTGDVLEPGSGEIVSATFEVNEGASCGSFDFDFASTTVFSDSDGLAYFWEGEGQSISVACDANLSLVQVSDTVFEVHMSNSVDVAGFQFNLVDSPDNFSIVSAETTDRADGYMISANASGTVIAFSLTGDTIAPGDGAIVVITADGSVDDTEVCFEGIVLADPSGIEIEAGSECSTFDSSLDNDEMEIPQEFSISKIYPNPFNPSTTIEWTMRDFGSHRLDVYNTNGQLVEVISQGYISPGYKQSTWDASSHASGIYIIRLVVDNNIISSNKVMLVK